MVPTEGLVGAGPESAGQRASFSTACRLLLCPGPPQVVVFVPASGLGGIGHLRRVWVFAPLAVCQQHLSEPLGFLLAPSLGGNTFYCKAPFPLSREAPTSRQHPDSSAGALSQTRPWAGRRCRMPAAAQCSLPRPPATVVLRGSCFTSSIRYFLLSPAPTPLPHAPRSAPTLSQRKPRLNSGT